MKPIPFERVRKTFDKWLEVPDRGMLDVTFGSVVANLFRDNPVWLFIVAPPSGMKSELINSMKDTSFVVPLSDLTPRTLASGYSGGTSSLIHQMDGKVMTFKDFTTVLSKPSDDMNQIFSQLREIYDEKFDKSFGNGTHIHWEGKMGVVSGVTQVIDSVRTLHSVLGERFLLYRPQAEDRRAIARRALGNVNKVNEMREELALSVKEYLEQFVNQKVTCPPLTTAYRDRIVALADLTAYGRVGVTRARFGDDIEFVPKPENPARLAQSFALLAQGIAVVNGRTKITEHEMGIVKKVAGDTMIAARKRLLEVLYHKGEMDTKDVVEASGIPGRTTLRRLEDLWVIGCLERVAPRGQVFEIGGRKITMSQSGQSYSWRIADRFKKELDEVEFFA